MRLWPKKRTDTFNTEGAKDNHPETVAKNQVQAPCDEVLPPDFLESLRLPKPLESNPGRHLLVFLDGTWNEERVPIGEVTPTNVLRMFQELNKQCLPGRPQTVIARYYRGVGSRQDNSGADRMWFGFNGKDEERIRAAALAGLYRDYRSVNDAIYIIGFSRGAACARLLARDICVKGLPAELKVRTRHFSNLLTGQIEARVEDVEHVGSPDVKPSITFLGCWDTVDAFVLPSRFPGKRWKDKFVRAAKHILLPRVSGVERFRGDEAKIPEKVHKAVHCVAIDESRNAFLPTLMPPANNVEEVWFPGVHSDVGGGYGDNSLADEAYEFMKDRLLSASRSAGINDGIYFSPLKSDCVRLESYCFHFHGLNAAFQTGRNMLGFGSSLRKIRVLEGQNTKPKVHSSLFKVMESSNVYAANQKNNRTWRVNYDPYNFRELREYFETAWTGKI